MLIVKRLWQLMKNNRKLYLGAIIATFVSTYFSLFTPIIIRNSVNALQGDPFEGSALAASFINAIGGMDTLARNLWISSIAVIAVTALQGFSTYLQGRWRAEASESIAKNIKDNLYDHLQKLPFDYHVKAHTGDLIQRCTSDVETIRRFLSGQIVELIRMIFIFILAICVMLPINIYLTLICLSVLPLVLIISYIFFKNVKTKFLIADEKEAELSATLQENISAVRVVRAFGRQQYETDKFEEKNSAYRRLCFNLDKLMATFWSGTDLLCIGIEGVIIVVGAIFGYFGYLSIGDLILFTSYEGMLIWPMRNLGRILNDMGKMEVSLGRVYEVLKTPEEKDTIGTVKPSLQGDIIFEDVHFGYDNKHEILKGMSFHVKAGQTVAILGATGSGKTTLMHILIRLYDYTAGSIKINGVELRNIEKKWLREKVGIVLQDPFLFSRTIRENIKMAKFDVVDDEIYDAAQLAAIHDVIKGFENGYETPVGEKGVTLSGGQKQRVAISRTLIKNSDILIFDDSLSAVDTETDKQIREGLNERQQGITTIIISQRITTLMEADIILVMEDGRLQDSGTHEELITRDNLYYRIWKIQSMLEENLQEEVR